MHHVPFSLPRLRAMPLNQCHQCPPSALQHDDGIIPSIVDAVKKTVGNRKNPNGCAVPLTW